MYQFYYADPKGQKPIPDFQLHIRDRFHIAAVRPTMWEEHCLECAAPLCFGNCLHFEARKDGRCKRFANGLMTFPHEKACNIQGVRVKFRKWGNMMTVLFPAMMSETDYRTLHMKTEKQGKRLKKLVDCKLPLSLRWNGIRTVEFLRRRKLRGIKGLDNHADAFLFHGYSHHSAPFRLIIEIFDDHTPLYKTSLPIEPGENMHILTALSPECEKADLLVKIYPENDLDAELDILWCDFVQGESMPSEQPAPTVKCLVWDLDGTLWNGILIETDDPKTLKLKPGVLETLKAMDERGIIQSVASKNDYDNAYPVLERLGVAEYFLYPQIHWNAKSGSMKEIAKSLNIGIDSLALIDDSVFEREQVRSALPMVRVYDVTETAPLLSLPEFQVPVTEESRNRRQMYRAEEKRNQLRSSDNTDTIEFLKKCHLQARLFAPTTEAEKLRCYELVVRTNQLNMSGKKYTPEEFEAILSRPDHKVFALSCGDDFGEYGIVGFGQYKIEDNTLVFTEFAMSCRVAGKFVESALFSHLLQSNGYSEGSFVIRKTKKNSLLRNTLDDIGFTKVVENDELVSYSFSSNLNNRTVVLIHSSERTLK
ncbi:MAG: HAD-IIIC family phosphatase [Oscillospiraceae bacterium]|nr:HAD-IIIC family phosphatase [Oscillospiraceae bacterium]